MKETPVKMPHVINIQVPCVSLTAIVKPCGCCPPPERELNVPRGKQPKEILKILVVSIIAIPISFILDSHLLSNLTELVGVDYGANIYMSVLSAYL